MKGKYKATGCAKFFLVLIVLAPLAYIGASYFNGQDGIANFKDLIGISADPADNVDDATNDQTTQLNQLESELEDLREENEQLKQALEDCQDDESQ